MESTPDGEERRTSPPVLAGRYRVVRTLASADTGATFIVFDVRLRRWRTMDVPWPGQRTAAKRLIAQAEKLARLEHPAVERVVDLGAEGAIAFVVRDRLHGSLAEHLESRGALSPALAAATVIRIADGLEHAHSVGLLHGQIRPRLVRFADDAGVVLTGFGEIRVVDATTAGRVAEPWAHLAPEQVCAQLVPVAQAEERGTAGHPRQEPGLQLVLPGQGIVHRSAAAEHDDRRQAVVRPAQAVEPEQGREVVAQGDRGPPTHPVETVELGNPHPRIDYGDVRSGPDRSPHSHQLSPANEPMPMSDDNPKIGSVQAGNTTIPTAPRT